MNIVLLEPEQIAGSDAWKIESPRQLQHLRQHLEFKNWRYLESGIRQGARYLSEVLEISEQCILVKPVQLETVPEKLPVHLILALPRPKVLRRIIMDAVTIGVERISLIHSYRVDKSYWQTPFLQQMDDYVTLGLEQAGDTMAPEIQLYKRFSPLLKMSCRSGSMPSDLLM